MTAQTATNVIRVLATVVVLFGILTLVMLACFLPVAIAMNSPLTYASAGFNLLIGSYLVWVGYLVWYRSSPFAVRHCCGAIGFIVVSLYFTFVPTMILPSATWALGGLVLLLFVMFGYRMLSHHLNRVLFPAAALNSNKSVPA